MTKGERIRYIRKSSGLTMAAFGNRIGISPAAVSKIESGKNNPDGPTVKNICREFGVAEKWLTSGEGAIKPPEGDINMFSQWAARHLADESNDFKRRFMNVIMNLSESEWAVLEAKLREMFEELKNPPDGG